MKVAGCTELREEMMNEEVAEPEDGSFGPVTSPSRDPPV
jgi:hypothetical protein